MKTLRNFTILRLCLVSIIVTLGLLFPTSLNAQSFAVKNYTEDSGLSSAEVFDVLQDSVGYMWFSNRSGITRYDGSSWKTYTYPRELKFAGMHSIIIDQTATIWALPKKLGISLEYYDGNNWKVYKNQLINKNVIPYCFNIINDSKDTTLAVGSLGYGLFINKNGKWTGYSLGNGFISDTIYDIDVDKKRFYVATSNGISIITDNEVDNTLTNLLPSKNKTVRALKLKDNKLWILSEDYSGYIENNKFFMVADNLEFNFWGRAPTASILPISDTKLIISSANKSYLVNPISGSLSILGESTGLINNRGAYDLFQDREQNIWITGGYGISKIPKIKFYNYNTEQGLYRDEVSSIEEIIPGKYFIGQDYGYSILSEEGVSKHSLKTIDIYKMGYGKILDSYSDKKGNLWIAAEKLGFGKFNGNNNSFKWYQIESKDRYTCNSVTGDLKGNIWGLTINSLVKLNNNNLQSVTYNNPRFTRNFRKLFVSPSNKLYIATNSTGIVYQNNLNEWEYIKCKSNVGQNNVYAIHFTKERTFVGTRVGLYFVDGDSLTFFNNNGFSLTRPVYFINRDSSNAFWFGTDKGVVRWNRSQKSVFGTIQGLSGLETNRDAGYIDTKGNLWIGTNGGMSKYIEDFDNKYTNTTAKPIIRIASIFSDTVEVDRSKDIIVPYNLNSLTFEVQILSFIDESDNRFRYRLDGLEDNWHSELSGLNPFVRYFHLKPGKYQLFVQAKNANDIWGKVISSEEIFIESPFYTNNWFYFLLIVLFLLFVYSIGKYIIRKRYTAKLELEVSKQTIKLEQAERQYRQMFEENRAIMITIEPVTGKIKDANAAALIYYGYSKAVLLEKNFKDIDYLYDEEFEIYRNNEASTNYYLTQHQISNKTLRDVEVYFTVVTSNGNDFLYAIIHDVSDRIAVEKELHLSEEKYRNLIDSIQDGVFVLKKEKFVFINDSLAEILGYDFDELMNHKFEQLIHEDEVSEVMHNHRRRLQGDDIVQQYEIRMLHKSGKVINMLLNVNRVDFEGEEAIIGTAKNITQLKRSEETLRKLSMAVEQSPVSIVITNVNGEIEYVNPTFTNTTGYELPEVFRQNPRILKTDHTSSEEYKELWDTLKSGNVWRGEFLNRKKNGELFWVSSVISPVKNSIGQITHFLAVEEDITFGKYAKDELKNNERLFNSVFNNVPVVLFALNREAKITLARGKILEDYGITEDMVLGRKAHILFRKMDVIAKDIKRALNEEEFKCIRNIQNRRVEVSYSPIYNEKEEFSGTIGIAYDITESENVKHELIESKEIAENSDRLKSEFLAQMSHEIRTPINSILSFTSLLKSETEDIVNEELKHCYQSIDSGGRRLIRTVDLILNMAQIQTDSYKAIFTDLDISYDILEEVINDLKSSAKAKSIDISYNINTKKTMINGDQYTLVQIFLNLVENAIKYTEKGFIKINVNTDENNILSVTIEDTGIGIAKEFIPHLFSPFSQEESGYTRRFEGNGLGLALVYEYVKINKAVIKVESKKGVGSTFMVKFKNQTAK